MRRCSTQRRICCFLRVSAFYRFKHYRLGCSADTDNICARSQLRAVDCERLLSVSRGFVHAVSGDSYYFYGLGIIGQYDIEPRVKYCGVDFCRLFFNYGY